MGNLDDPTYRTQRLASRSSLAAISSNPPNSPYQFEDSVDASHPANLDFILPMNIKPNFAKLSVKFRLFRTYSSLTLSSTGTDASTESGHNHSHAHNLAISGGLAINENLQIESTNGAGPLGTPGTGFTDSSTVQSNATGSSGHSHSHSHTVSGTTILGVSESTTTTTISAIAIDGVDVTAQLPATATTPAGGPWANDFVDLDLTSLMPTGNGAWHVVSLTATGLGRLMSILRLG